MGIGFRAPYAGTGIAAVIGKEEREEAGEGEGRQAKGSWGGDVGALLSSGEGQAVATGKRRLLRGAEGGRQHCPVPWSLKAEAAAKWAMR